MEDKYIGKKLDGRYKVLELIGSGGMAYVYKAEDVKDGKIVAVKILKEEFLDNEELLRRFKNESKAIGLLSHDNIVKVYDVNFSDSIQYIVMEYVDGITLRDYMDSKGKLSWKDTVFFTTQILKALQHAHDRGIVHRDIKPQNIMLLEDGSIKVMDFGIARFEHNGTRTITDKAIGSVHYISPEQARGEETSVTADIYSVGVVMYEMLTGTLPFDSDSAVSVAIKQISDTPKDPTSIEPSIPKALEEITLKAMSKNPEDRYQSADQMLRDFDEFKKDPDISFEYKYMTSDEPTHYFEKTGVEAAAAATAAGAKKKVSRAEKRTASVKTAEKSSPNKSTSSKSSSGSGSGKKKKKKRKYKKGLYLSVPIMLLVTLVFVIGSIILMYMILTQGTTSIFSKATDISMPNFIGKTIDIIQTDEQYANFEINIQEGYSSQYGDGYIYSQSPAPGKTVKENASVTLYVSKGTRVIKIPDNIIGMNNGDAVQMLQDLGLTVMLQTTSNNAFHDNEVVSIDPPSGTEVQTGTKVTVTINSLTRSTSVPVPDLIGKTYSTARSLVNSAGLVMGTVTTVESDEPAGTVILQSIEPNNYVDAGRTIDITISSGIQAHQFDFNLGMPYSVNGKTTYTIVATLENGEVIAPAGGTTNVTSKATVGFTVNGSGSATMSVTADGVPIYKVIVNYATMAVDQVTPLSAVGISWDQPTAPVTPSSTPVSSETEHVHNYSQAEITTPATCTLPGIRTLKCSCGDTKQESIPATGHQWSEWVVDTPAGPGTEGAQHRTCSVCGTTENGTIPALPVENTESTENAG